MGFAGLSSSAGHLLQKPRWVYAPGSPCSYSGKEKWLLAERLGEPWAGVIVGTSPRGSVWGTEVHVDWRVLDGKVWVAGLCGSKGAAEAAWDLGAPCQSSAPALGRGQSPGKAEGPREDE